MFTGIIEKTVRVIGAADGPHFRRLTLANTWPDIVNGQSISVNGCCLTVADFNTGEIAFDVISETLEKTNLGLLSGGDEVNVERALRLGDRLDGHFVQGHVDGPARLIDSRAHPGEWRLTLEARDDLQTFLTSKGSVTLDGVSLTIAAIKGNLFEVALIPTTMQLTTIGRRPTGWPFNLEIDILSKTVISWLQRREGR